MAAEIWDLYDGCGEKTGRTMVRGEAIPTGFYHIGVHIWPMKSWATPLRKRKCCLSPACAVPIPIAMSMR